MNPATVVQAYRDLAAEGFVAMRHGQGTFIQEVPALVRDAERAAQATRLVRALLQDAARIGISVEELARALNVETGVEIRE